MDPLTCWDHVKHPPTPVTLNQTVWILPQVSVQWRWLFASITQQRHLPGCLRKGSFTRTWQERETRILSETLARLFAKGIFHTNLARERKENNIRDTCPAVCERDLSHEPGKREKREYYQRRLPGCLRKGSFTRTWQERERRIISETLARLFAKGIFHTNLTRERKEKIIRDACRAVCERDLSHEPGKREKGE